MHSGAPADGVTDVHRYSMLSTASNPEGTRRFCNASDECLVLDLCISFIVCVPEITVLPTEEASASPTAAAATSSSAGAGVIAGTPIITCYPCELCTCAQYLHSQHMCITCMMTDHINN